MLKINIVEYTCIVELILLKSINHLSNIQVLIFFRQFQTKRYLYN
jgi:hypothetical protein